MSGTEPRHLRLARPSAASPQDGGTLLIGRDIEQALLRRLTLEVAEGQPSSVAVCGLPGTGRSVLLRQAADYARSLGVIVLAAQGSPDQSAGCGIAAQLAHALAVQGVPGLAPWLEPVLARHGAADVEGFCRTLLDTAHRQPVTITVDDVQCADRYSREVLCAVLRRHHDAPLSVILAMSGTPHNVSDDCAELLALAGSPIARGHVLSLGPLGPDAVRTLSAGTGTDAPDAEFCARAVEVSGGNPAVLRSTLRLLARSGGAAGSGGEAGARPAEADRRDLGVHASRAKGDRAAELAEGLIQEPLALLRVLSVCGPLLPTRLLSGLVEERTMTTAAALRVLRAGGLVAADDPPRLADPSTAERLLAGMDDADRRRLYRQAARLGHRAAVGDEALAELLIRARPLGEPWVSGVLRRAAATAVSRNEHALAVRCLERALQEPVGAAERLRIRVELGAVHCRVTPEAGDRQLTQVIVAPVGGDVEGGPDAGRHRAIATDLLLARGDANSARRAVALAYTADTPRMTPAPPPGPVTVPAWASALGTAPGPALAQSAASAAALYPTSAPAPALAPAAADSDSRRGLDRGPDRSQGVEHGRDRAALLGLYWLADSAVQGERGLGGTEPDLPALPRRPQDPTALAAAAWRGALQGRNAANVRELASAALRAPARGLPLHPRVLACRALGLAGATGLARQGLDAVLAEARSRRAPALIGYALLVRSELSLRCGQIDSAARDLALARTAMPEGSWHSTMVPATRAAGALVAIACGRWKEAELIAYAELPSGSEHGFAWNQLLFVRGLLLLAQGRPQDALAELRECGRRLLARGWESPGLLPWRSLAALAHECCREHAEALRLAEEERRLTADWGTAQALEWADLTADIVQRGEIPVHWLERVVTPLARADGSDHRNSPAPTQHSRRSPTHAPQAPARI
ncbi:AAA ATPase-like protein [Streptomyces sp. 846.5]|nr:AAA family ATPase [Streptomyces sp. 846.5]TDT97665.1 AAA ATPase-like protein [Streptomyces sp. 846.5]